MSTNELGWLRVLQAVDPLFPVGAFTLSNGLETYVQKGVIVDAAGLRSYLGSMSALLPYSEVGFAAKAAAGVDLRLLDELCTASRSAFELREGSRKLCARFIKAQKAVAECPELEEYESAIRSGDCSGCHCIALGLYIAGTGTDIFQGLSMYCYSLMSAAVNHAVKLVPLSQLDGQRELSRAAEHIPEICRKAMSADLSELGAGGAGFELRAAQHETLYSRMYIS